MRLVPIQQAQTKPNSVAIPSLEVVLGEKSDRVLVLDAETALRWFWYDGKGTVRLQMFVAAWADNLDAPMGKIILPRILLEDSRKRYESLGLPVASREEVLRWISDLFSQADLLVGHNIKKFDLGVLNAECMLLGLPLVPQVPVRDSLADMKKTHGMSRALGNQVSRIPGATPKPNVDPVVWERAFNDYEPEDLLEVWNRCVKDVRGHYDLLRYQLNLSYLR